LHDGEQSDLYVISQLDVGPDDYAAKRDAHVSPDAVAE
jgi:hypothetical protein